MFELWDVSVGADIVGVMKLVVQVRLDTDTSVHEALSETLAACNRAASWVSEVAFNKSVFRKFALQELVYGQVKAEFGLSAQPALRVLGKVEAAYKALHANLKAGSYGKPGSRRRVAVESKPVVFRDDAAQPFDDRCLSWQIPDEGNTGTVSIWTTSGRIKGVKFSTGGRQMGWLRAHRKGESDLVLRDGVFYLYATVEVPEAAEYEPDGWTGVDLGIVNIAYTSDGQAWSGGAVTFRRKKNQYLRTKLQAKGSKGSRSAKRLLKQRSRKETRFVRDTNHKIAHRIVTEAQRTGTGIALETLTGIRQRARLRKPQRVTLHTWAFSELGELIEYKARLAGVPLVYVNPAYTSQRCSDCGHTEKLNRQNQAEFVCRRCGTISHADHNAARNIAQLGELVWAAGQKSPAHQTAT